MLSPKGFGKENDDGETWGEEPDNFINPPVKEGVSSKQTIAFALKMKATPTPYLKSFHPDFLALSQNPSSHPGDTFDDSGLTSVPGLRQSGSRRSSLDPEDAPCMDCLKTGRNHRAMTCRTHAAFNCTGPSFMRSPIRSPRLSDTKSPGKTYVAPNASAKLFAAGKSGASKPQPLRNGSRSTVPSASVTPVTQSRRSSISGDFARRSRTSSVSGPNSASSSRSASTKSISRKPSSSSGSATVSVKRLRAGNEAAGSKNVSSVKKASKKGSKKIAKKASMKSARRPLSGLAVPVAAAAASAAISAAVIATPEVKRRSQKEAAEELENQLEKDVEQRKARRVHARDKTPTSRLFAPTAASKLKLMPKIEYTPLQKRDYHMAMRNWLKEKGLEQYGDATHALGLKNSRQVPNLTEEQVRDWAIQAQMTKHDTDTLIAAWWQEKQDEEARKRQIDDSLKASDELIEGKKGLTLGPLLASPLPSSGIGSTPPLDMQEWLKELGLGKYAQSFEHAGYHHPADVFALSQKELKAFILRAGMTSELHASRLRSEWLKHCTHAEGLREWLKRIGLGRYAGESVLHGFGEAHLGLKNMSRRDVEHWADLVKMAPAHRQRLLLEWAAEAKEAESIRVWMTSAGLETYVPATVVWRITDVGSAAELTEEEVAAWAQAVEMKEGHAACLLAEWKKLQKGFKKWNDSAKSKRTAPGMLRWLKGLSLDNFAKKSLDNGYDDVALIWQMKEEDVEKWGKAVEMGQEDAAKLKAGWKNSQEARTSTSEWLTSRGLGLYVEKAVSENGYTRVQDLKTEEAVKEWGSRAGMPAGHVMRLVAEWGQPEPGQGLGGVLSTQTQVGSDSKAMEDWLRRHGLQNYVESSLAQGHDDLALVSQMHENEVKRWSDVVKMDEKASERLYKAWNEEVQNRLALEQWLSSIGLGDSAYQLLRNKPTEVHLPDDLGKLQKQEVENWAAKARLRAGAGTRLLAEWRVRQQARKKRGGAAVIAAWLRANGLAAYVESTRTEGFDQIESVGGLTRPEVNEWAQAVKMTPADKTKLVNGWQKDHAASKRLDMEQWLRAKELSSFAEPTHEYGVDDPALLPHLTKREVTLWAEAAQMQPGQAVGLLKAVQAEARSYSVAKAAKAGTMAKWLKGIELASHVKSSKDLGYDDPAFLKYVSFKEGQAWAEALGLTNHDTQKLAAALARERASASGSISQWLEGEGLGRYGERSKAQGYDSPDLVGQMEDKEAHQWADKVGMNPAHGQRLVAAVQGARAEHEGATNDYALASWLSAHGLIHYESHVKAKLDKFGVQAPRELSAAELGQLIVELKMPPGHAARLKRGWGLLPNASSEEEGSLAPWLAALGLEAYAINAAKFLPGDDVSLVAALSPAEADQWTAKLGMLPGHEVKLAVACRKLRSTEESKAPATDVRRDKGDRKHFQGWMSAAGLGAYADGSRRYLGHSSVDRLAQEVDEDGCEAWAHAMGMEDRDKKQLLEAMDKLRQDYAERKAIQEKLEAKRTSQQKLEEGLKEFMANAGLEAYTQRSVEEGYDLGMVRTLHADDVASWAETVGMNAEENKELEEAWKAECAKSQRVGDWLEAQKLGQYAQAAEAAGFIEVGDLVALNETALREWAAGPGGFKAGHQARLVSAWRLARNQVLRGALMMEEEDAKDLQRVNEDLSEWLARAGLASTFTAALAAGYQEEDGSCIWTWEEEEAMEFARAIDLSETESNKAIECWEGDVGYARREDPAALRWQMGALERNRERAAPSQRILKRLIEVGENAAVKAELGVMGMVQLVLSILSRSEDPDVVKSACWLLATLTFDNQVNCSVLVMHGGITAVLQTMSKYESSVLILDPAASVLCNLCFANQKYVQDIVEAGGADRLVSAGSIHLNSSAVLPPLLTVLVHLSRCRSHRLLLMEAGAARFAVAALRQHPRNVEVVTGALRLLGNLSLERDPNVLQQLVEEGVSSAFLAVPGDFPGDVGLADVVVKCLQNLVFIPLYVRGLLNDGVMSVVRSMVDTEPLEDPTLAANVAKLIKTMANSLNDLDQMVGNELTVQTLCRILDSYSEEIVIVPALMALADLSHNGPAASILGADASDPLGIVCTILQENKDRPQILIACFQALCALARSEENSKALLPQLSLFFEALEANTDNAVFVCAHLRCMTNMAFHLSCGTEVSDDGISQVVRAAQAHPADAAVWLRACKALNNMAYVSHAVRQKMETQGVPDVMRDILVRFAERGDVVHAAQAVMIAMSVSDSLNEEAEDVGEIKHPPRLSQAESIIYAENSEEDSDDGEDLDCEMRNLLLGGTVFMLVPEKGMPYAAHLYCDPSFKYLIVKDNRQTGKARHRIMPDEMCKLVHLVSVEVGHCTIALRRPPPRSYFDMSRKVEASGEGKEQFWVPEELGFAILGKDRTFSFAASSKRERDRWVDALLALHYFFTQTRQTASEHLHYIQPQGGLRTQ
eukprot:gb/GEZN01000074.1/.p1 GENE.gb/GEZN01000074.1/~~gb/GEZN01000074.1/.p1  ORF type:complete len:2451 (-),score=423.58 gb/GEZN01000074.1/:384-7736(-)